MIERSKTHVSTENGLRQVIVNADDFGYASGVNRAVFEAADHGILTSATVLVDGQAAHEVRELATRQHLSVGLHLDMVESEQLNKFAAFLYLCAASPAYIEQEFRRQVDKFTQLTGHLPHSIDGHYHVHLHPRVLPLVKEFSEEYKIPVRSLSIAKFVLSFHGKALSLRQAREKISPNSLIVLLNSLSPGVYEVMCHPGYLDEALAKTGTTYLWQRPIELETLTHPKVNEFVHNNQSLLLINWKDIGG